MPLYSQWSGNDGTGVRIWKVTEDESFFAKATGLVTNRKHPIRRLEHLAGRFLLQQSLPGFDFGEIGISDLGKPFLPGNGRNFSISHSFPYIGVATDNEHEIGMDVQTLQEKINRLKHKFLSEEEQAIFDKTELVTLAWTAKEAAFKKYGLGGVDFIQHMPLRTLAMNANTATMNMDFLREDAPQQIKLHGQLEDDFVWSVTVR
ncbi:MAG: 4'-phosphopantetheinyl transferase superfamily protein [Edaphocola sp.]